MTEQDHNQENTSREFVFEHRIFSLPETRFHLSESDRKPVMHLKLGDVDAVMKIEEVTKEFNIGPDSPDGKMLTHVANGLRFVKMIYPGDDIPSELLDGSASWSVEDHHREIAKNRLMIQIATWMEGEESVIFDLRRLRLMSVDPEIQNRVRQGIEKIGTAVGIAPENMDEVLAMIDKVAREICYIEALRDQYSHARGIRTKLARVDRLYVDEKQFHEEVRRVRILIEPPIKNFSKLFQELDAQTSEIVAIMKNFDSQISFIRQNRDLLREQLVIWQEFIDLWDVNIEHRNDSIRDAVKATYRFVAVHFPQTNDWV